MLKTRAAFHSVILTTCLVTVAYGQTAALSFRPIDAEYSTALDRIIMVSAGPSQLHIYNPVTKADTTVTLSAAPNAVSVSPDGLFAAVGHDNLITYVNLSNASVTKTFTLTLNVNELVLAANYIYLPPTMSIQISNGAVAGVLFPGSSVLRGVLSPGEQAIYWIPQYSSTISRASTATGVITNGLSAPYNGSNCYNYSNGIWLADSIVYTSCGSAYEASPEMRFAPALSGLLAISGLATAPGLRAAIPAGYTDYSFSPPRLFSDNEVHLLSGLPPLPNGRFVLPDFSSGSNSFVAHGRWLFFDSAGSKIFTVIQADGASGLLNDFAVQTTSLTTGSCSTVLTPNQLSAPGAGTLLATSVTSAGNCAFQVTSNVPWIKTETSYGGGPTIVNLLVRPNSGAARSGTVTIGSDNLTVSQDAAPTPGSLTPLSFKVVAAEFSKPQNRLLLVARSPNEFHLINPATLADQIVPLSFVPRSLAVTPDGNTVAVGGDGAVAFVNVSNGAVTGPFRVPTEATGIMLPGNGYAFLYSTRSNPISVSTSTGVYTVTTNPASPPVRLSPGGRYGYSAGNGIQKWDFLTAGTATLVGPVPNPIDICCNARFWFSEDGLRMFTSANARVYRTSDNLSTDLIYNGMLADVNFLSWAANSAAVKTTAVTSFYQYSPSNDTELILYGDEFLGLLSKTTLPSQTGASGIAYPSKGRFVFWSAASDKLIVVVQADPQTALTADYAVYVISAGNCAINSLVATNAAFAIDGGASQFPISASPGCAWKATSNASWLTINSGGFGIGSASVGYTVAANSSGATRTGLITVSGLDFTVTQSAGTLTLNPTALSFAGLGGAASVAVTASAPTVAWTAQATVPWLSITSNASGTGSGTVGYAVAPNALSTSRTGTITIGGVTFTVTQAGSTGALTFGANYLGFTGEAVSSTLQVISATSWVAASTVSWLRITSPANGVGAGTRAIDFTLDRNPGPGSRNGAIVVNGQVVQIFQSEAPPTVTLDPTSISVNASGGPGTIRQTSSSTSYYWSAYSNATWVTIAAPTSGSGSANISYAVAANTSTAARSALIFIGSNSVVVNQAGSVPPPPLTSGLHFVPATPCRIADTREILSSGLGKPALAGGAVRDFAILAACGIPATARAYSLNLTVVPKGPLSYISIWPAGTSQPLVSTLNSPDGRVKANAAIVPAGVGGAVSVYATSATELVIDINGYFVDPAASAIALAFYPITPCRIADTRNANGSFGGPVISNGSRSFPILSSACGIPATAQAYSLNTTAVPSGPLGYLTLWPTGQSQPFVSTLNAPNGNIVANAAIVPAGVNGAISAFASGSTNLVIDINGYFAPPGAANALKFFALTPCRLVDTRNPDGPLGGPIMPDGAVRSFPLSTATQCGVVPTARAFSLNATVVPTSVLSYLTLWPTGQAQPLVSTLNALDDTIVANAAIVSAPTPNGTVSAYVTNRTHLILDTNGYFAP